MKVKATTTRLLVLTVAIVSAAAVLRATEVRVPVPLHEPLADLPAKLGEWQAVQDVRMGGRSTRTQYQYSLQDANLDELSEWAPKMVTKLSTLKELRDVASDQQTNGLQLAGSIDRDTASRLGITPGLVDQTLATIQSLATQ